MSLNPFTKRREDKEEKLKEKLTSLQGAPSPSPFGVVEEPEPISVTVPEGGKYDEDFSKFLPESARVDQQSLPAGYQPTRSYEPPSRARQCLAKMQSGFMIGGALGGAFGTLYGTYAAVVNRHILYLPIAVVQAGAAFGFFLACGTVIRCEEALQPLPAPAHSETAHAPGALAAAAATKRPLASAVDRERITSRSAVVSAVLAAETVESPWLR